MPGREGRCQSNAGLFRDGGRDQPGAAQELARRRHQGLPRLRQEGRKPGFRYNQQFVVFRIPTGPVRGQHRLGGKIRDQHQTKIRNVAARMLDDAQRPRLTHRVGGKPQFLLKLAQQLAMQIGNPIIIHGAGVTALVLLAVGGLAYTVGAVFYALRRPNPWPNVFGHHEFFHACTLAAAICHHVAIYFALYA